MRGVLGSRPPDGSQTLLSKAWPTHYVPSLLNNSKKVNLSLQSHVSVREPSPNIENLNSQCAEPYQSKDARAPDPKTKKKSSD